MEQKHIAPQQRWSPSAEAELCPLCRFHALVDRHCKMICLCCGYVESCEDIFPLGYSAEDKLDVD